MKFESQEDLIKKTKAVRTFVDLFGGSFVALGFSDTDYKVFDKNKKLICYVEICLVNESYDPSKKLSVAANRLVKLASKRLNPVVVWAFNDGIVYSKVIKITGEIKWADRNPEFSSYDTRELMVFFEQQKNFKYEGY